jgi:hypothetical protein
MTVNSGTCRVFEPSVRSQTYWPVPVHVATLVVLSAMPVILPQSVAPLRLSVAPMNMRSVGPVL